MAGLIAKLTINKAELAALSDALTRAHLRAGKEGLEQTTKQFEKKLEAATKPHSGKLWRAWASRVEPGPGRIARNPVGYIYLNGRDRTRGAMEYIATTGRIRPRNARFLAIPLPAAGSRGRMRDLTPQQWEQRTGAKLRLVPRRGKPWLLVLDEGVLSGKKQIGRLNTARRRKAGRENMTIPIFMLIPESSFTGRFSIDAVMAGAASQLAVNVQRQIGKIGDVGPYKLK